MRHTYRPVRFYATVFAATWICWVAAILLENEAFKTVALVLGLLAPSLTAIITVFTSGSDELKQDFKEKLTSFHRLNPRHPRCNLPVLLGHSHLGFRVDLLRVFS